MYACVDVSSKCHVSLSLPLIILHLSGRDLFGNPLRMTRRGLRKWRRRAFTRNRTFFGVFSRLKLFVRVSVRKAAYKRHKHHTKTRTSDTRDNDTRDNDSWTTTDLGIFLELLRRIFLRLGRWRRLRLFLLFLLLLLKSDEFRVNGRRQLLVEQRLFDHLLGHLSRHRRLRTSLSQISPVKILFRT